MRQEAGHEHMHNFFYFYYNIDIKYQDIHKIKFKRKLISRHVKAK